MFYHSVFQIFPSLFSLFWAGEDISVRSSHGTLPQFLSIILHYRWPAHQLHGGELFQEIPAREGWKTLTLLPSMLATSLNSCRNSQYSSALSPVFGYFFQFLVNADSMNQIRLFVVIGCQNHIEHHTLQSLKDIFNFK